MPISIGKISAAERFGGPLSFYSIVEGSGQFAAHAEHISQKIAEVLAARSWIVTAIAVEGIAHHDKKIGYAKTAEDYGLAEVHGKGMPVKEIPNTDAPDAPPLIVPDYRLKAHEENHVEVMSAGFFDHTKYTGRSKAYFDIVTESLADAVGELTARMYEPDPSSIDKCITERSRQGAHLIDLVGRVQQGPITKGLEKQVQQFYQKMDWRKEYRNWAGILGYLPYLGLYGPCTDVLKKNGIPQGKEIIYQMMRLLQQDPEALSAISYLMTETENRWKIPLIEPFIMYTLHAGTVRHIYNDDELTIDIFHSDEKKPTELATTLFAAVDSGMAKMIAKKKA